MTPGLERGPDGLVRCWWCNASDDYRRYHDTEWGFPVADDTRLFEKICLEGFQSGLSWLTILRKREAFREAFHGFDFARVARFTARDVERLLANAAIVRHRGKIQSTINNARRAGELAAEQGSLAAYFWRWQPDERDRPRRLSKAALVSMGAPGAAYDLSKDLKRRGWTFVGPTTVYSFMQAMGLVNDHLAGCPVRQLVETARAAFNSPARSSPSAHPRPAASSRERPLVRRRSTRGA